jgi:hypothetical protein
VTRCRKKNPDHPFYCSKKCYSEHEVKGKPGRNPKGNAHEGLRRGSWKDEFSPFRYFLAKARDRKHLIEETDLDLPYLKALWEQQQGRCALSGINMVLPTGIAEWVSDKGNPWKPSLDRIDSTKGYIKGNVRYVTVIANLCKQGFSDEVVVQFGRAVAQHNA